MPICYHDNNALNTKTQQDEQVAQLDSQVGDLLAQIILLDLYEEINQLTVLPLPEHLARLDQALVVGGKRQTESGAVFEFSIAFIRPDKSLDKMFTAYEQWDER